MTWERKLDECLDLREQDEAHVSDRQSARSAATFREQDDGSVHLHVNRDWLSMSDYEDQLAQVQDLYDRNLAEMERRR